MNFEHMVADYGKDFGEWLKTFNIFNIIVPIIIAYVLCRIIPLIINWIVKRAMRVCRSASRTERLEGEKRAKTLADLFSAIIKFLIVITVTFDILTKLGINLQPLIASAGLAGVAIGFGAQSLVKDSLAGFFIIFENQYRVDDVIRVSGTGFPAEPVEGTVRSITLRKTTLRDRDGNVHIIPNGSIVEVTNRTLGFSKFRFTFAVDVETDVDGVIDVVNTVGDAMAKDKNWGKQIVDAPHYDELGKMGKEGINVTVSGTTLPGAQWKVSAEYRRRLVSELQKSDITVADVEG